MTQSKKDAPATRRDLEAAKSDLTGMITATRSDLTTMATATRSELKAGIDRLDQKTDKIAAELVLTHSRMERMEQGLLAKLEAMGRESTGRFDSFLNRLDAYARESVTLPRTLDEHGRTLKNHENRLGRLEGPGP